MSGYLSDKLQKLQNRAANVLLAMLTWGSCLFVVKKQKALIMYKTLNDLAPDYLQCLFIQRHIKD